MSARVARGLSAATVVALSIGCTHDFGRFHEGAGGSTGTSGGTAGTSTGGTSNGGASSGGTNAGGGGATSSGGSGAAAGSVSGGSGGSSGSSASGGTAGSTASGGTAGTSSGGSAGAPACSGSDVSCSGTCADLTSSPAHCGSCGNSCTLQGKSTGFFCQGSICWCTGDAQCKGGGGTLGTDVACDETTGQCQCGTALNHCNHGELCLKVGPSQVCTCGGVTACPAGNTCCYAPAGCRNLQTDNSNCGACGHACTTGTTCQSGQCLP